MRTTIDLPDPLFKKLKARAAMDGVKLREFVTRAVESALNSTPSATVKPRKFKPLPVIKHRGARGPLMKIMSNDVIAQLELEEDLERLRQSARR